MNVSKCFQCRITALLLICSIVCRAQVDTAFAGRDLTLTEYLNLVGQHNLGYAAQQYDVSIANAGIAIARIFPDPELTAGAYDNQNATLQLGRGYAAGITTMLELGGKRKARTSLARSGWEQSKALLQHYFYTLRTDAALAYFNAIQQYYLLMVARRSYTTMKQLADADSIRFKSGVITETDARQSKLEAGSLLNNLFQRTADWKNALVQLSLYAGKVTPDSLWGPARDFERLERSFSLEALIREAQNSRTDIVMAVNDRTIAVKKLQLVTANRKADLGISAGIQFSGQSVNETAPTPAYRSVSAGLSIPLKLSNACKGELRAAQLSIKQSALRYEQVLVQIKAEVAQAWLNYEAAEKQVRQFKNGLLAEAEQVLTGKIYSYKRGETSLLEVLNAQRTYNEVQQHYYEAQFNYANTLIVLERSAGIWDMD